MALIILNGPSECGKGEAYKLIQAVFNAGDGRVKKRLYEIACPLFQVPESIWWEREGKETPNPLLAVTRAAYIKLGSHVLLPALPAGTGGECWLSPRQALIYASECVAKPMFGRDYFGRERLKQISAPGLYVDDSGGFPEEVIGIDPREILLIRVHGRGRYSPQDSRGWLNVPGAHTVDINNDPSITLEEYLGAITRTVHEWWGGIPLKTRVRFQ